MKASKTALAIVLLIHVATFFAPHREGDEVAFLALSQAMHWDLGNYTTRSIPGVNEFAADMYRGPLFIHPPLWPLVLKILALLGDPVRLGLFVLLLGHAVLVDCMRRGCEALGVGPVTREAAQVLLALCPVLAFTSTRLNSDGPTAILAFALAVQLLELLVAPAASSRRLVGAAVTLFLLANTKLLGIALYPPALLVAAVAYGSGRAKAVSPLAAGAAVVLALAGLQHAVRLVLAYGSVLPPELYRFGFPQSEFVRLVLSRTRLQMAGYLLAMYPFLALYLVPETWRRTWQGGSGGRFVAALTAYLALVVFAFSYNQERYWSPFAPLLFLGLAAVYDRVTGRFRRAIRAVVAVSAVLMVSTLFLNNQLVTNAALVQPALFHFLPFLAGYYR